MLQKTMKAAILKEFHSDLIIETVPIPSPGHGEVLVRVKASGLCASDLHIQDGMLPTVTLPFTPGHEMAGIVEELGEGVTGLSVGEHVVCAIDITCGVCRFCRRGKQNLCKSLVRIGFERNGSHEQYCVVPAENLFPIRRDIPFAQAAIIPDAVVCMYHAIKNQGKVTAGDRVLLLGVGGLGLQGVQIARYFGAQVYATSRQDKKLEIAKQFGAHGVINTRTQDLIEEISRLTQGEMCDVIFDNIGIQTSIETCLSVLRPGGKIVVVGYNDSQFTASYQDLVIREKEIIGIRGSTRQDLAEAIRLVEDGIVTPYVSNTFSLEEINSGLHCLRRGESFGRTVVLM